jgi:hypothetical protein
MVKVGDLIKDPAGYIGLIIDTRATVADSGIEYLFLSRKDPKPTWYGSLFINYRCKVIKFA